MGTQNEDRGGENHQKQQPGRPGEQNDASRQAQDQGKEQRRMSSDDDVGGEMDADGEINQPGQTGNQDRERSGSTRSRNP